jgi:hypothetical protein
MSTVGPSQAGIVSICLAVEDPSLRNLRGDAQLGQHQNASLGGSVGGTMLLGHPGFGPEPHRDLDAGLPDPFDLRDHRRLGPHLGRALYGPGPATSSPHSWPWQRAPGRRRTVRRASWAIRSATPISQLPRCNRRRTAAFRTWASTSVARRISPARNQSSASGARQTKPDDQAPSQWRPSSKKATAPSTPPISIAARLAPKGSFQKSPSTGGGVCGPT